MEHQNWMSLEREERGGHILDRLGRRGKAIVLLGLTDALIFSPSCSLSLCSTLFLNQLFQCSCPFSVLPGLTAHQSKSELKSVSDTVEPISLAPSSKSHIWKGLQRLRKGVQRPPTWFWAVLTSVPEGSPSFRLVLVFQIDCRESPIQQGQRASASPEVCSILR